MFTNLIKNVLLIATAASFGQIAHKVSNQTTPNGVIKCAIKGIVLYSITP